MLLFIIYFIVVNIAAFGLMGSDKQAARQKRRRVPEKRLFTAAAIGGAVGAWIGMRYFRHKTKHASFTFGIPLLVVWNAVAVYFIMATIA